MGKMVGIDLGTTNTVVAIVDGPRPRVLETREGKPQLKSVVSLKRRRGRKGADGKDITEILVGDAAYDNWGMAARDTILSVKRLMGRGFSDPEVQKVQEWAQFRVSMPKHGTKDSVRMELGDNEYSPVDISALILKKAKEDAEYRLGEEVTHAVITVPAYFSQIQRHATRQAGLKAGLKVIKILDEPTAAAIAFGMESKDDEPKTVLVYDLGGGTFDVSLLMVAGNIFAPLNLEGDMWLGGDSLDQVIVDRTLRWVKEEYEMEPTDNHRFMAELRKAAQNVKERLTSSGSADLLLAGLLQDEDGNLIDVDLEILREEFERMILPLTGRHKVCVCGTANDPSAQNCAECGAGVGSQPVVEGKAIRIVRRALKNANQSPDQIDHIIMAGNSSAVPLVQRSMEELFGAEKVLRTVNPKQSVAMGAAIVARWMEGSQVCVAPDPADPTRECGFVNEPDAAVCAQCGAHLLLEEDEGPAPAGAGEDVEVDVARRGAGGRVGGIAPFHYGTQTAGDKFTLFIHKSDPFPTDDPKTQTFYTRAPAQRMVSVPIYGGDDLNAASANELQGQAFVLLPADLPAETPVRITLWLDNDAVFDLKAHLGDGTRLDPWIVTGEADAVAINGLQRVEELLARKADAMSPQARTSLEKGREKVFDRMKERDFDGAVKQVEELEKKAEGFAAEEGGDSLREKAETLIGYGEFLLREYSWAFDDPNAVYRLTKIIEETREVLARGDNTQLEAAVAAIDKATDDVPKAIQLFMGFKGAIVARIQPVDPALAARLMAEVGEIEGAIKNGDMGAMMKLESLAGRIAAGIEEAEKKRPGVYRCGSCGSEMAPGQRICPSCGADSWLLGARGSTGSF